MLSIDNTICSMAFLVLEYTSKNEFKKVTSFGFIIESLLTLCPSYHH
ncbi:hypothetical protein HNQ85_003506 [Anoxybacillus calidus]|uniref:Uncharacterized protein n=1 Tax=[Anoxybacillus] calidus TaxID=575178 RepID=A0A7V9Z323_9BACL|nr:hypothetical protein [Anoxybacillus calidus]